MTAQQPLSEILRIVDANPVCRSMFTEEQLTKYRIIADRLALSDSARPFRVVFCGVFSSGKTSLINSLLASSFHLPEGVNPVTKMVTRIRGGRQVACAYRLGGRENAVSTDYIEALIKGQKQLVYDTHELIVTVPSKILQNRVEFLDTPGFNDEMGGDLERMSREAIYESDMAVMCCSALQLGKIFERQLLQELDDLMGHFSLVVTRMDNLNTVEDCDAVIRQANRLMKDKGNDAAVFPGDISFVFPVVNRNALSDSYPDAEKHIKAFENTLRVVLSDESIRRRIRQKSDEKALALCLREIQPVFDRLAQQQQAELTELTNKNSAAVRQREWNARTEQNRFADKRREASYAAQQFARQRMGTLSAQIMQLHDPSSFQLEATRLTNSMIAALIGDIAAYSAQQGIASADTVVNILNGEYFALHFTVPPLVKKPVRRRGPVKRLFVTLFRFATFRFQIDDGCEMEYAGYQEPAVQAVWNGPVPWLLRQWDTYLERVHGGMKTDGFYGGYEQAIRDRQTLIDLCEKVRQLTVYGK